MISLKFGFNFEFIRDKSKDELVKEHEAELARVKKAKEILIDKLLTKEKNG